MPRFARLGTLLVALLLVAAACGSQQAPPRSPFGPGTSATVAATNSAPPPRVTAVATTTATAPVTPPATSTAAAPPAGTPAAVDRELAIGQAIQQLAQWLGVEQASINLQSFQAQDFPDSCLGVERPGIACATVVTPGARVMLLDALDHPHDVRMDAAMRRFAWAPEHTTRGTVVAVDMNAQTVTLRTAAGELTLRRVPGTLEQVQLQALHAGDTLDVGYDGGPLKGSDLVLVWTARP